MARRPAGRHVRRVKRITPRRWLPFVALTALVAGAVVAERDPATIADRTERSEAAAPLVVPEVAEVGAISSAWFCGGGTAQGEGVAELTVVIANSAAEGAVADVTVYDEDGGTASKRVDVPARGRARVRTWELLASDWSAATVEVRGGRTAVEREVAGPLGFDTSPCSSTAASSWSVASGSTVRGAEQYLSLFNPFPDDASVDVAFTTDKGTRVPGVWAAYSVPARSLRVLRVSDQVKDAATIAARVEARSGRLVVDRLQTYDGSGDEVEGDEPAGDDAEPITTAAPSGVVSSPGTTTPADRWVFPGARLVPETRTQVAIYNPTGRTAAVDVVISYQDPETVPEVEPLQVDVPAHRQRVVDLTDVAAIQRGTDFTIDVRSIEGVPVVAERLAFYGPEADVHGAAVSAGSPLAATRWLVVQGGPTKVRTSSASVANLGPRPAVLRVVQLTGGTETEVAAASITVPPGDRAALDLGDVGAAATLVIESSEPIVVSSLLAATTGDGLSVAPAVAFPETLVALPSPR